MVQTRRGWAACLLVLTGLAAGVAQAQIFQAKAPEHTITVDTRVPEIPFEIVNDHIILEMTVNGEGPFDVVLDTGMPMSGAVLYAKPETNRLELGYTDTPVHIGGAGGSGHPIESKIALDEGLEFAGLDIDHTQVLLLDVPRSFGTYHDGIVGALLFSEYAVEIDAEAGVVRLHDPKAWKPPQGSTSVPLKLIGNMPFVTLDIAIEGEATFPIEVVVDLGASHAISLNTDASKRIDVPNAALPTNLGHGLSGPIEGHIARVGKVALGAFELEDVVASFPESAHQNPSGMDSKAGNLGSGVLNRFNTTFDYENKRMVLVPNDTFEDPFEFAMSGMTFEFGAERLVVDQIFPGSAAADAGIRAGDIVVEVDGRAVSSGDRHELSELFETEGRKIAIVTERNGKRSKKSLKLRRLI